ncbi:anti-sigma-F factor Fin family protein [Sporosarcina sp. ACRSL]|uniref:anti-sigma-F factor Fin n=1 Tax=Sporosarcina sp. ACRSL TaxID=2918215 RepID=UPI001EF5C61B|nr:anti-sigma-F factor Fin [Sporosarcina sp. ACRSL]MCG7346218.1 anti-sigma-F factor Fin family protein [Sporosarcina sp. ACRSL]
MKPSKIRYSCRHCNTEVGSIPFSSAEEIIRELEKAEQGQDEQFLEYDKNGSVTVRCICEQCEQSLRQNPDYYALRKWLQ